MTIDLPRSIKLRASANCPTGARTETKSRTHEVVVDEPIDRGGTDLGPSPLELFLSSYLSCTNVIANRIAAEMGIELNNLSMDVIATLDTSGIDTATPTNLPFPKIELRVNVETSATDRKIEQLKADLAKRCPITVILRQAGTELISNWQVRRP